MSGWREGYSASCDVVPGSEIQPGFTKYNVQASAEAAEEICREIAKVTKRFDFELEMSGTAEDLRAGVDFLKSRRQPPQFIGLGEGFDRTQLAQFAAIARSSRAVLSIPCTGNESPEVLGEIGKATGGRVNYKFASWAEPAGMIRVAEHLRA